jgi:hypothetical protein
VITWGNFFSTEFNTMGTAPMTDKQLPGSIAPTLSIAEFEKELDSIIRSSQPESDKRDAVADFFEQWKAPNQVSHPTTRSS